MEIKHSWLCHSVHLRSCASSADDGSTAATGLRGAIDNFWLNANEAGRGATSVLGLTQLHSFIRSTEGEEFLANCMVELRAMNNQLDSCLSSCGLSEQDLDKDL